MLHGHYWGIGWWMVPLGILFWVSVVALIVWVVRRATASDRSSSYRVPNGKRPIDHLEERYAKGEIDDEEYERVKRKLEE